MCMTWSAYSITSISIVQARGTRSGQHSVAPARSFGARSSSSASISKRHYQRAQQRMIWPEVIRRAIVRRYLHRWLRTCVSAWYVRSMAARCQMCARREGGSEAPFIPDFCSVRAATIEGASESMFLHSSGPSFLRFISLCSLLGVQQMFCSSAHSRGQ